MHIAGSGEVHFPEEDMPQCGAISINQPNFSAGLNIIKRYRQLHENG